MPVGNQVAARRYLEEELAQLTGLAASHVGDTEVQGNLGDVVDCFATLKRAGTKVQKTVHPT